MELRLLDIEGIHGLTLARDKLDLSAAFLIPYLLQLALSANFKVRPDKLTAPTVFKQHIPVGRNCR